MDPQSSSFRNHVYLVRAKLSPRVYGPENGSSDIESVRANLQDMVVSSTTSIPTYIFYYLAIS